MSTANDNLSMAIFCDFENVALGVRDAQHQKFDIKRVLEKLLLKGSIVVKKAYCDWDRYKGFKATMHEANFELIEIPHVRQSGKNSADIRLVVDALDLCYTKAHVNTFVIISGDSDFSPLVSKLRENAKQVIGVGVKQSTSDLLIANCDEFIYYDDLVRDSEPRTRQPAQKGGKPSMDDLESRRQEAVAIAGQTFDELVTERGDTGRIWASVLKEAIKRRKPGFNENYYGFKAFGDLLEAAQKVGLLSYGRDDKSGAFVTRAGSTQPVADIPSPPSEVPPKPTLPAVPASPKTSTDDTPPKPRRRTRSRKTTTEEAGAAQPASTSDTPKSAEAPASTHSAAETKPAAKKPRARRPKKAESSKTE